MNENTDLSAIVHAACGERDGRETLPCKTALTLAEAQGVDPTEVAAICNKDGIKLVGCQLGCFE